jgi:hypothetical protein
MRPRLFSYALMMCTALPVTSHAQLEERFDSGWYFGGGISLNDVFSYESYCLGCYGASTYGDSDSGFTVTAGLRVNEHFAVEGSYYGESTMRWNEGVVVFLTDPFGSYLLDADIELSSWQVSVVGILAGRKWEGSLRLGLALWSARSQELLTSLSDGSQLVGSFDHDGEDLVVGLGIGRNVGKNMQVRLDYAGYPIDDELLGVGGDESANADSLSLQILWRFGRSEE